MSPSPTPDPERDSNATWIELAVIWLCIIVLVASCARLATAHAIGG